MKSTVKRTGQASALIVGLLASVGCESTDSSSASGAVYYGVGFYDPWYYGGYYDDPDIIVTPPSERPDRPHVEHPIARPTPTPRPTPSIPSTPRAAPRGGGGRR